VTPTTKDYVALTTSYSSNERPTSLVVTITDSGLMRRQTSAEAVRYWQLNHETQKGSSGGALVDQSGRLLGIASGVSNRKGYYCHLSEIERFLSQSGMEWLLNHQSPDAPTR
jgi:S1-C subfamily serine protease